MIDYLHKFLSSRSWANRLLVKMRMLGILRRAITPSIVNIWHGQKLLPMNWQPVYPETKTCRPALLA